MALTTEQVFSSQTVFILARCELLCARFRNPVAEFMTMKSETTLNLLRMSCCYWNFFRERCNFSLQHLHFFNRLFSLFFRVLSGLLRLLRLFHRLHHLHFFFFKRLFSLFYRVFSTFLWCCTSLRVQFRCFQF